MAVAVLATGVMYLFIPANFQLFAGARIGYPGLLVILLGVLIVGDPGRIDRQSRWLRIATGALILTVTVAALTSAVRLVVGLLTGASFASPGQLLTIGVVVWVTIVIAFALWYWHLDRGGPAARARGDRRVRPAWRFPEEDLPSAGDDGWFAQFVDYFALSFNTATAFSPTDVSAIRHWPKLMMVLEASVSLTLIGLVVARAVNVL